MSQKQSKELRALNRAIKQGGGIVRVARTLGVTTAAVQNWRTRGLPAERVGPLAEASGVPREDLRPDLFR